MSLKNKCLEQQNLWYILYRQFYNVSSTMCIHFLLNSQSFIQQRSYFLSLRIHFRCSFYEEFFCISVFETDFSFFGSLFLPLYSLFFSVFLFLIVLFPVSEKLLFLSLSLSPLSLYQNNYECIQLLFEESSHKALLIYFFMLKPCAER